MNKKCILLFIAVLFSTGVFAQSPISVGFKFGMNSSKFSTKVADYNEQTINNYLAGAFVRLSLSKLYIQPELYFNTKGGKLKQNAVDVVKSIDLKTLDVPILVGYKLINLPTFNVRVNAGPVVSFVTDKKISDQGINLDEFKDKIWGWQYGAGVDFLFLSLDFRVEKTGELFKGLDFKDNSNKSYLFTLGLKIL
ncbi:PorT family protein [Prolixibacteraceae bacterium JC049]|nr:PorT family protein [Prolixibacteraceae bacterium JC049]